MKIILSFLAYILLTPTANAFIWSPNIACDDEELFTELAFLNETYSVPKTKIDLSFSLKNYQNMQKNIMPKFGRGGIADQDLAKSNVHLGIYMNTVKLSILNGGLISDYAPYRLEEYQVSYEKNLSNPSQIEVFEITNRYMYGRYTALYGMKTNDVELVMMGVAELLSSADLSQSVEVDYTQQYYKWIGVVARLEALNASLWMKHNGVRMSREKIEKAFSDIEHSIEKSFSYDYMRSSKIEEIKREVDRSNTIMRRNSLFLLRIIRFMVNKKENMDYIREFENEFFNTNPGFGYQGCFNQYRFWFHVALSNFYFNNKNFIEGRSELSHAITLIKMVNQPYIYKTLTENYSNGYSKNFLYIQ